MTITAILVTRAKAGHLKPGKFYDPGGLILRIRNGRRASWIFRYERDGRRFELGLGSIKDVTLAEAREAARAHRSKRALGGDPLRDKRAQRATKVMTFDQAAELCIADRRAGWRNAKHAGQWSTTLATYASPVIGALAVADVDAKHVIDILKPIWSVKPDTASRVRGRLETVLDWAKVHKHRAEDQNNPARWRGHLSLVFQPVGKVKTTKHHAAVPIDKLPMAFKKLGALGTIAAEAVMFTVLCAARPGEVQQATWDEIDFDDACWQLAADRTKTGKPHRVPLSDPALAILKRRLADRHDGEALVFPGNGPSGRLWPDDMLAPLRAASGLADVTLHGTARSTFDDWASERTAHPQKCIDLALGHGAKNRTTAAYRRSDLYEQRKPLMHDWGAFLDG
jgi:integrase